MYLDPNLGPNLQKENIEMEKQNREISGEKSEELPAKPSDF